MTRAKRRSMKRQEWCRRATKEQRSLTAIDEPHELGHSPIRNHLFDTGFGLRSGPYCASHPNSRVQQINSYRSSNRVSLTQHIVLGTELPPPPFGLCNLRSVFLS